MKQANHRGAALGRKHPFFEAVAGPSPRWPSARQEIPRGRPSMGCPRQHSESIGIAGSRMDASAGSLCQPLNSHQPSRAFLFGHQRKRLSSSALELAHLAPFLLEIAPADQPCRHAYEVSLCAQPSQAATAILPGAPGSLKGHPPRPASAGRHGASPGAQDPPEAPSPPSQHCPGTTIPRSPCTRLRRALYRPGSAPAHGAAEVLPI